MHTHYHMSYKDSQTMTLVRKFRVHVGSGSCPDGVAALPVNALKPSCCCYDICFLLQNGFSPVTNTPMIFWIILCAT